MRSQRVTPKSPGFALTISPTRSHAGPLITSTCSVPKGFTRDTLAGGRYHYEQSEDNQLSTDSLRPITIVIDSDKKRLLIVWTGPTNVEALAQQAGVQIAPARSQELRVSRFAADTITAIDVRETGGVSVYSLFPKLGVLLISEQYSDGTWTPNVDWARQSMFVAKCSVRWHR